MKILRDYIAKDFISSFIFSLLAASMILLLGNLVRLSDMVIRKGVNVLDALKIFFYLFPSLLALTIPLSGLVAVMLVMGRLISDNELTAINANGISSKKILAVFLTFGAILSLGVYLLNDEIIPQMRYNYHTQLRGVYSRNVSALIEPGAFSQGFKDHIIYAAQVKNKNLTDVLIYETPKDSNTSQSTYAKTGSFEVENETLKLTLYNGVRDQFNNDQKQISRLAFKTAYLDVPLPNTYGRNFERKLSDMPTKDLIKKIKQLKTTPAGPAPARAELYKRINLSLAPIILIWLGFAVSLMIKHREKSINFSVAFLLAGIYYLLTLGAQALAEQGLAKARLIMWGPNLLLIIIASFIFIKYARNR